MAKKVITITESQYKRLQEKKKQEVSILHEFKISISNTKNLLFEGVVNKNYVKEAVSKSIFGLADKNISSFVFESAIQIMLEEGISEQVISEGIADTFKKLLMKGVAYGTIAKMMGTMLLPLFLMFAGGNANAQSKSDFQKLPPEKKVEMLAQKVNHGGGGDGDGDDHSDGHDDKGHGDKSHDDNKPLGRHASVNDLEAKVKSGQMVKGFADVIDSHGKVVKQPVYAHDTQDLKDKIEHIKQMNQDEIKSDYKKMTQRGNSQGSNGQIFNDNIRNAADRMDALNKVK